MTTQEILQQCTVDGNNVKLPDIDLDKPVYQQVKKSLELIGGKWTGGKTQAFVFQQDPTELLAQIASGEQRNLKKEFQFFPTPEAVAMQMASKLAGSVKPGAMILEPSAGDGALIKALNKYFSFPVQADCYELMDLNRTKLAKLTGATLLGNDFLKQCRVKDHYDVVMANPPFTNNQDILHFAKMYEVLKPGGVMITLSSTSWTFGSKPVQVAFRSWLHILKAEIQEVPAGAFFESGTQVVTQMIQVYKPLVKAPEIPPAIMRKLVEASKPDETVATPAAPEPLSQTDVFGFLRKYNGYAFFDDQTLSFKERVWKVSIYPDYVTDPRGIAPVHTIECEYTGPAVVNQQIWKAREWVDKLQRCRVCGCTEYNCKSCIDKTGEPCTWIADDLCSACEGKAETANKKLNDAVEIEQSVFFFQKLAKVEVVDLLVRIYKKDGNLTVSVTPGAKPVVVQPNLFNGSGSELDACFFDRMLTGFQDLEKDTTKWKSSTAKHNPKGSQPTSKKKEIVKPAAKKTAKAVTKPGKNAEVKKPAKEKVAKPVKHLQPPMFIE